MYLGLAKDSCKYQSCTEYPNPIFRSCYDFLYLLIISIGMDNIPVTAVCLNCGLKMSETMIDSG